MKTATSRFVIVAAIAALAVLFGAVPVVAQVPNFPSGFNQGQLCPGVGCSIAVIGSTIDSDGAAWTPNVPSDTSLLRLTDDVQNQRGAAWFTTAQPVTKAWTSTFQFQLSSQFQNRGDGFAFVIQKNGESSLTEIGGFGGGLGYGTRFSEVPPCTDSEVTCTPAGDDLGIPNSLAIEFDTYPNTYDPDNHHIAVQSCGTAPNSPNHHDSSCNYALASTSVNMADGASHTVRIDYSLPSCSDDVCGNNLLVYIDGSSVLTAAVDIDSILNLDGTFAFVGFTAATRGAQETHDILSWTFSPSQTQTVPPDTLTLFEFQGGFGNPDTGDGTGYNYNVKLAQDANTTDVQVTPLLKSRADCEALLQQYFAGTNCFLYHNPDGANGDFAVLFEITCPGLGGDCSPLPAELGSDYHFKQAANPTFESNPDHNPLPGWLKGHGPNNNHPCDPDPDHVGALFQSNQISSFTLLEGDPPAKTKGGSGGTGSCWVATYNTPGVVPSVSVTTPANNANYPQGANIASAFTCTPVNAAVAHSDPNFPAGPYLTVPTTPTPGCTAAIDGSPTPITSGTPIPTTAGPHTFVATVLDSGLDTKSTQTINYNVVGPTDVAIAKVGPLLAPVKSKVTYIIGVGNIGPQPAVDVNVTDILPANTTFVSVSANKVSCSIVNKKLVCTTTSVPCTGTSTVSCSLGTIQPLSLSNLNGATIKLTVQLGNALTAGKVVKNTATVSSTNTDTKTGNNSSTASTLLTAH